MLYTKSVVTLLMFLLITMQLFIDELHFIFVAATLLSHVAVVVISNLLWIEFVLDIVTLIQVVATGFDCKYDVI